MREFLARLLGTARLVLYALLPPVGGGALQRRTSTRPASETAATSGPEGDHGTPPFAKGGRGGESCRCTGKEASSAPSVASGTAQLQAEDILLCAPRQIRGGMDRLLDSRGELALFFPRCMAIAAPVLLFRLKREGFSECAVQVWEQGLLVRGRR